MTSELIEIISGAEAV
ncbi:MAG: hypothetical protein B7Z75_11100 [Acidocella sp. 20-57-95]|nr:MAG: hypothetical protein B7Z75_11100 [Acidocella sp. 20-57-95]